MYLTFDLVGSELASLRKGPYDRSLLRSGVINGFVLEEMHFVGTYENELFTVDGVGYDQLTVE